MKRSPGFKRNDPCPCGSGVPYKFCHQAVLEAPLDRVLQTGHEQYIRAWGTNSGHFEARGYYADLAHEVHARTPRRLIDVGCGLGQGLKAIINGLPSPERFVIGLDENPLCIDRSAATLAVHGIDAKIVKRMTSTPIAGSRDYELAYEPQKLNVTSDVTLIQSDITEDPELDSFLAALPPFDAITLWFTGTHTARQGLRRLRPYDERNQREMVESRTFELAGRVLRSGGFVHIAMRGGAIDGGGFEAVARTRIQQLAGDAFEILPLSVSPYTEPTNYNRVGMVSRDHDASRPKNFYIVSTVAVKR